VLAVVLVVAGFAGAFAIVRGAGNPPRLAYGPAATTTTGMSTMTATDGTTSSTATTMPGLTPVPTATSSDSSQPVADVRVTKNQDMRTACMGDKAPYTVVLYNAGSVAANWHVNIPATPVDTYPYWANANPQDGTVASGQTASFVMTLDWPIPCGGKTYHATVQLSFLSGASQADIPLTYAGTGPVPYSNVVLASGSLTSTEACPANGSVPAPFTFAITNAGNAPVDPGINEKLANGSTSWWANLSITKDPAQEITPTLIYPGQVWTVAVSPIAGVSCNGTPYYVYIQTNNVQGGVTTLTLTYTFTGS